MGHLLSKRISGSVPLTIQDNTKLYITTRTCGYVHKDLWTGVVAVVVPAELRKCLTCTYTITVIYVILTFLYKTSVFLSIK